MDHPHRLSPPNSETYSVAPRLVLMGAAWAHSRTTFDAGRRSIDVLVERGTDALRSRKRRMPSIKLPLRCICVWLAGSHLKHFSRSRRVYESFSTLCIDPTSSMSNIGPGFFCECSTSPIPYRWWVKPSHLPLDTCHDKSNKKPLCSTTSRDVVDRSSAIAQSRQSV